MDQLVVHQNSMYCTGDGNNWSLCLGKSKPNWAESRVLKYTSEVPLLLLATSCTKSDCNWRNTASVRVSIAYSRLLYTLTLTSHSHTYTHTHSVHSLTLTLTLSLSLSLSHIYTTTHTYMHIQHLTCAPVKSYKITTQLPPTLTIFSSTSRYTCQFNNNCHWNSYMVIYFDISYRPTDCCIVLYFWVTDWVCVCVYCPSQSIYSFTNQVYHIFFGASTLLRVQQSLPSVSISWTN